MRQKTGSRVQRPLVQLCRQQGVALLEFAFILPLMLLLLAGAFEVGLILSARLYLIQGIEQGIGLMVHFPNARPGCFNNFKDLADSDTVPTDDTVAHYMSQRRALATSAITARGNGLLNRFTHLQGGSQVAGISVSSEYITDPTLPIFAGCGVSADHAQKVGFRASGNWRLFFLPISVPVSATIHSSLLYTNQTPSTGSAPPISLSDRIGVAVPGGMHSGGFAFPIS